MSIEGHSNAPGANVHVDHLCSVPFALSGEASASRLVRFLTKGIQRAQKAYICFLSQAIGGIGVDAIYSGRTEKKLCYNPSSIYPTWT
jgi:hypothetical protein